LALPFPAQAQQATKIPRIGILRVGSSGDPYVEAFRQGLRDLGYVEGRNITIEYRYAEGKENRLAELAADLVRLKVDIIVVGGTQAITAVKNATQTIPIVMGASSDPVGTGLVASLARPGGNITGLSLLSPELSGKRLELLKEMVPKVSRFGLLCDSGNPATVLMLKETEAAARALGLQVQVIEVRSSNDFDSAFAAVKKARVGALNVLSSSVFSAHRKIIVEFATKNRLPAIYNNDQFIDAGGLTAYGPNIADLWRRAATFVDKILKGRTPADLPVEQPMKFEFIISLPAAKKIGLTVPPNVLVRATKVIK
jgi:putative ABC transport system substrate-binding protein